MVKRNVRATAIQRMFRGFVVRECKRRAERAEAAALLLQRVIRRRQWAKLTVGARVQHQKEVERRRREQRSKYIAMLNDKASIVQRCFRIWRAGKILRAARALRKRQIYGKAILIPRKMWRSREPEPEDPADLAPYLKRTKQIEKDYLRLIYPTYIVKHLRQKMLKEVVDYVRKKEEDKRREERALHDEKSRRENEAAICIQRRFRIGNSSRIVETLRRERRIAEKTERKRAWAEASTRIQATVRRMLEKAFVKKIADDPKLSLKGKRAALRKALLHRMVEASRSHAQSFIHDAEKDEKKLVKLIAKNEPLVEEMGAQLKKDLERHQELRSQALQKREENEKELERIGGRPPKLSKRENERKNDSNKPKAEPKMLIKHLKKVSNHLWEEKMVEDRAIEIIQNLLKRLEEDYVWRRQRDVALPVQLHLAEDDINVLDKEIRDRERAMGKLRERAEDLEKKQVDYYSEVEGAPKFDREDGIELEWLHVEIPHMLHSIDDESKAILKVAENELARIKLEIKEEKERMELWRSILQCRAGDRSMERHILTIKEQKLEEESKLLSEGKSIDQQKTTSKAKRKDMLRMEQERTIRSRQRVVRRKASTDTESLNEILTRATLRREERVVSTYRRVSGRHEAEPKLSTKLEPKFAYGSWRKYMQTKPWLNREAASRDGSDSAVASLRDTLRAQQYHLVEKRERLALEAEQKRIEEEEAAAAALAAAKQKEEEEKELLGNQGDVVADLMADALHKEKEVKPFMDRISDWWNQAAIDEEKEMDAIEKFIRNRQKDTVGYIEGFRDFKITVGNTETEKMRSENEALAAEDRPHYELLDRNFGRAIPVYLWYQITVDLKELITGISFGNTQKGAEHYKNLKPKGWIPVSHPMLQGDHGHPDFTMWIKKGGKKPITHIAVSFNRDDEAHNEAEGFKMIHYDLGHSGLPPGVFFWVKQRTKGEKLTKGGKNVSSEESTSRPAARF